MASGTNSAATRAATRLAFLAAGFVMGCWSPLIPYAKLRIGVDDAGMGLLLLCLGIGSVVTMPLTGLLTARLGTRPVLVVSGIALAGILPTLAMTDTGARMAFVLLLFGAMLGALEVAMNVHAVQVEGGSDKPLMSGFHAMFSIGGFAGSAGSTFLLSTGITPIPTAVCGAVVALATILAAWPRLLPTCRAAQDESFVLPRGIVLLLAALAGATFLTEGAILDWGALLLTQTNLTSIAQGGLAYTLFSVAMTVGRLNGDRIIDRIGNRKVLIAGGSFAVLGFVVLLTAPNAIIALSGFALIGLGASNIVPILFSQAGRQTAMPHGLAVAALTTAGYAGILAGPALIGFVAHGIGLKQAFWMLAAFMCLIPLFARRVAP